MIALSFSCIGMIVPSGLMNDAISTSHDIFEGFRQFGGDLSLAHDAEEIAAGVVASAHFLVFHRIERLHFGVESVHSKKDQLGLWIIVKDEGDPAFKLP